MYVLITDFFIFKINADGRIKGLIDLRGRECKITGLADDMLFVLFLIFGLLEVVLEVIVEFSFVSDYRVNLRKIKIICFF